MNTLKPLLIVAVLAGVGYGVYVRINSGNNAPPPEVAEGWDSAPNVQLPDAAQPSGAPWGPGGGANSAIAPSFAPARSVPAPGPAQRAADAPAFNPPPGSVPATAPGYPATPYNDPAASAPVAPEPAMPDAGQQPPNAPLAQPETAIAAGPSAGAPADPRGAYGADPSRTDPGTGGIAPPEAQPGSGFGAAMEAARHELESGQLAVALRQLSAWNDDPRLAPGEQQQLNQLLDQVAGSVVYSTQHLIEPPYEVQPGERLEDIGQRYNVPWQLLAKINGIDDPQGLRPGERLKVVRGPFKAVISLERRQLTLLLGDGSYAGRFPIGIGREHPPQEGTYAVSDKVVNPVYHGRDRAIGADDQSNPLGERWIGLGSEMGIHGTNRPENIGRTDLPGSISLSPRDVEDVYDILTVGSKVTIRR